MPFSIDKSFIAKRVRMLRNDYTLTTTELAILLGFKRKTSITAIEVGRSVPSYEVLMYIVQLFGVSMDWLMGYSDIQYDAEVLLSVEKICPSIPLMELNMEAIPDDYLNVQLRAEKYTPWARGNIIYFRNLLGNIEYRDTELKNRVCRAKDQLKNLLISDQHILVYGRTAFEVTCLIPQIIKTFAELGISATPGYRSVTIHSVLGIQTDIEMSNEDIVFFCIENYDVQAGAACFFIEKLYSGLKENPLVQGNEHMKERLEELWQQAYKIRDANPKKHPDKDLLSILT